MAERNQEQRSTPVHWADQTALRVVSERGPIGDGKPHFTCASGITPSGVIHIGNFREIISVDLVVRALRDAGHPVRFIYSWDDFDVFRKVPKNMPEQEMLTAHLRWPITDIPDPYGKDGSYAEHNERVLEAVLPEVGVVPEYIYQTRRYRSGAYAGGIRRALEAKETIRGLLDEHRTTPLPEDWWPVSVFSTFTHKDTTTVLNWDGEWGLTYRCDETGNEETVDLRETDVVKLPWRVDWPMRWMVEQVDFEPAGKEHHSAGGSFDTAKTISKAVYDYDAPVTFKYDFISIKGRGGKISSSSGEVVDLADVLEVYEPEVVRYLFAGTRPNAEFAISFDLDVIKIYEDYDRCERYYFGTEEVSEKRRAKEHRTYELSQLPERASQLRNAANNADDLVQMQPLQIPFRTLCNFLMITAGDIDAAFDRFEEFDRAKHADQIPRLERRARCAWSWITNFAPEDFRFELKSGSDAPVELGDEERRAVELLAQEIESGLGSHDEKSMQNRVYEIAEEAGVDKKQIFGVMYAILIGKERGPRLGGFLLTIGEDRLLEILSPYRA
ncbi:MAG: lysine--tRNA ligase [Spirochaetales bacterium]